MKAPQYPSPLTVVTNTPYDIQQKCRCLSWAGCIEITSKIQIIITTRFVANDEKREKITRDGQCVYEDEVDVVCDGKNI